VGFYDLSWLILTANYKQTFNFSNDGPIGFQKFRENPTGTNVEVGLSAGAEFNSLVPDAPAPLRANPTPAGNAAPAFVQ
jgi:hypothetical protein